MPSLPNLGYTGVLMIEALNLVNRIVVASINKRENAHNVKDLTQF